MEEKNRAGGGGGGGGSIAVPVIATDLYE